MLFAVHVLSLNKIYDMPGSWCDSDYQAMLNQLEVEGVADIAGADLFDIMLMALQDMEPDDAADLVLAHKLQKTITPGSRQNIVQDLLEGGRPWEEVADIRLHARVFMASWLLNQALPKTFPRPDMMQLKLHLKALKSEAKSRLNEPPEAAFVTRLLADGMDKDSILERLFDKQLAARSFPEAEGVIWKAEYSEQDGTSALLTVYSSEHWLDAMETVSEFKSSAYKDRPPAEEDED